MKEVTWRQQESVNQVAEGIEPSKMQQTLAMMTDCRQRVQYSQEGDKKQDIFGPGTE